MKINTLSENRTKIEYWCDRIIEAAIYLLSVAMPFSIALTQNAFGLALLAWLVKMVNRREFLVRRTPMDFAFLAYVIAEIISLVFSTDVPQSIIYFKRVLLIPMVYLIANNLHEEKMIRRAVLLLVAAVSIYSLWGVISYLQNPILRVRHIQNSMTAGGISMIGATVALTLAAVWKTSWRVRLLLGLATVVILSCLFLTNTRGSWLGFFFAAVVITYFSSKKLLALVPVIAVLFYLLNPSLFSTRLTHFFDPHWRTNAYRLQWWKTGWEIFKDYPVVGIGDVGTEKVYRRYVSSESEQVVGHLHNNFIHIAVTLGTLGLSAFCYMIYRIFSHELNVFRRFDSRWDFLPAVALSTLAVFLGFNLNGLFEWNFGDAEIITLVWFTVGMALAIARILGEVEVNSEVPATLAVGETAVEKQ